MKYNVMFILLNKTITLYLNYGNATRCYYQIVERNTREYLNCGLEHGVISIL